MLHLSESESAIVKSILAKYPYKFYVFGSRAKGNYKKYSDLDICYKDDIPLSIKAKIEGDFEDSALPFTVDLLDLKTCDNSFKDKIQNDMVSI